MTRRPLSFIPAALIALALALMPHLAVAQSINFDMGSGPSATSRMVQTVLLVTVLSLAPSILVMVTCFTRIVVVLSFLRTAMGTQTTPPNIVMISLAMFLTLFIMQPTFDTAWENGVRPMMNNQIDEETAFTRTIEPFREFMLKHTRPKDLELFTEISKSNDAVAAAKKPAVPPPAVKKNAAGQDEVEIRALIPAFMISELRRAFEIGFLLFLPFLIIDMVVASILMAMGMMMLPPSTAGIWFPAA
jgi:flagellar biosynthetic protein FliP